MAIVLSGPALDGWRKSLEGTELKVNCGNSSNWKEKASQEAPHCILLCTYIAATRVEDSFYDDLQ